MPEKKPMCKTKERKADGDMEAHLISLSCSKPPKDFSRWSLQLLADKMVELQYAKSIAHEMVRRVLKKRVKALESSWMDDTTRSKQSVCGIHGAGVRRV